MTWDIEPSSSGEEGPRRATWPPPAETDNGEKIVSPKQRRLGLSIDPGVRPIPRHVDSPLVPGFEPPKLVETSLAEEELTQLANTEQSLRTRVSLRLRLTLNPADMQDIWGDEVPKVWIKHHSSSNYNYTICRCAPRVLRYRRDSSQDDDSKEHDC